MRIEAVTQHSAALNREMHVMIYGHGGVPFLGFPTQNSPCRNYEEFGMIDHLKDRRDVTIITHSLGAVIRALPYENLHVIVLPGSLRRKTNSMTGSDSVKAMKKYNIRTAFMAATGVSMHGATNSSAQEYDIKQAAVECSDRSILLVDRHKFGITGMMTYAPISSFEAVVTDEEPGEDYLNLLKENDVRLILPEEPVDQNKEGE